MSTGSDDKTLRQEREPFLDRWSRRKTVARSEAGEQKPGEQAPTQAAGAQAPPELPAVEKLDFDSDYRAFFHPKVSEDTRRAALKRLFSDARFNIMDGLDVYIDDYSKSDPIPPAMLAGLQHAQNILRWAKGEEKKAPPERDAPDEIAHAQSASVDSTTAPDPRAGERVADPVPADRDPFDGNRSPGSA